MKCSENKNCRAIGRNPKILGSESGLCYLLSAKHCDDHNEYSLTEQTEELLVFKTESGDNKDYAHEETEDKEEEDRPREKVSNQTTSHCKDNFSIFHTPIEITPSNQVLVIDKLTKTFNLTFNVSPLLHNLAISNVLLLSNKYTENNAKVAWFNIAYDNIALTIYYKIYFPNGTLDEKRLFHVPKVAIDASTKIRISRFVDDQDTYKIGVEANDTLIDVQSIPHPEVMKNVILYLGRYSSAKYARISNVSVSGECYSLMFNESKLNFLQSPTDIIRANLFTMLPRLGSIHTIRFDLKIEKCEAGISNVMSLYGEDRSGKSQLITKLFQDGAETPCVIKACRQLENYICYNLTQPRFREWVSVEMHQIKSSNSIRNLLKIDDNVIVNVTHNNNDEYFNVKVYIGDKLNSAVHGQIKNLEINVGDRWSEWSQWATCSKQCDTGSRTRMSSCKDQKAFYGGEPCHGNKTEYGECNTQPCFIPPCKTLDMKYGDPNGAFLLNPFTYTWQECSALCNSYDACAKWSWFTGSHPMFQLHCFSYEKGQGLKEFEMDAVSGTRDCTGI